MNEADKDRIKAMVMSHEEMMIGVVAIIEDQELDIVILTNDLNMRSQQYKKLETETEKLLMKYVEDPVKRDEIRIRAGYKKTKVYVQS